METVGVRSRVYVMVTLAGSCKTDEIEGRCGSSGTVLCWQIVEDGW